MRALDTAHVSYDVRQYEAHDTSTRDLGLKIATELGENPAQVFKTLVTVSPQGDHVVACIPVVCELDLKKLSRTAGYKSLSMIAVKDLEETTGYIRGSVSPIGMKKRFATMVDASAEAFDTITVSAGKAGYQLVVNPEDLAGVVQAGFADIIRQDRS